MKKSIQSLFLSLSLMVLTLSFQIFSTIHPFKATSVLHNIEFISSEAFQGRLAGTKENAQIGNYIEKQFINNQFKTFNGSYKQSFITLAPSKITGDAYLQIKDKKGNIIKSYTYGKDYKEDLLNFKKNSVSFIEKDYIPFAENSMKVTKGNDQFLFFTPFNNDLTFRSSFFSTSTHSMYIMVTKSVLEELKNYLSKGLSVSCFIPYEAKEVKIDNIIGSIPGKNPILPPILISAHFDHVGTDLQGTVYNGALDNASGISFLLEFSEYIKTLGRPDRTILFVAFNAEEFGCVGSAKFVEEYKDYLKGCKVFNFDMIGSAPSVPLCIMGGKKDSATSSLLHSAALTCNRENIYYNYLFEDASDHESFRNENIDAITFCDNDSSRIHTPMDKATFIHTSTIERCFQVASKEVLKYAYEDSLLSLYYSSIFYCSLLFSFGLYLIVFFTNKKGRI